ncbi:putative glycoprotease family protein [Diaporthe ampelina]|uniref:Putative glycoprotease family protein n=1 Tax=Diaporthe ampelina TaxID=1214573 RepID=A0A0G2FDT6_9PEZI|nr:putative glycoprotease family protein [Diaporthe ampelina]
MKASPVATGPQLPDRSAGTYVTGDHFLANYGNDPAAKIERTRRRHEKEDYVAHKAGGFWRGRGCIPEKGCYGRSGREGRQRRRIWIGAICLAFLLLTTLGVVLGVVLSRRVARPAAAGDTTTDGTTGGSEIDTVWLNLTGFPPIPTGLSTIVAPDNSQIVNGCAAPSTLWSCSLPPEQQAANEPHDADQPGFIFQIQYDNNTRQLWNIPNGTPPTPTQPTASTSSKASASNSASATSASASATNSIQGGDLSSPSANNLDKRATTLYDVGIAPNPDPPSFQEMWFLGNTTDGIASEDKAGEPTPFYISFFTNTSGSAGPNMLTTPAGAGAGAVAEAQEKRGIGNGIGSGTDSSGSLSELLPPPPLNADGTGAPAQLRPYPFQQPLRLFDRGLPTEHYGFYSYFNKTIYVTSMDGNETGGPVAADAAGGSREGSAKFLASWTQTRFVVKIWTRKDNTGARLMGGSGRPAADIDDLAAMPGTFPYPVTVGEDTHGGSVDLKATFAYGVEPDRHVNTTDATLFTNDVGFGGAAVNPRLPDGDLSWGGVDGGTGGCLCEWVNWVEA